MSLFSFFFFWFRWGLERNDLFYFYLLDCVLRVLVSRLEKGGVEEEGGGGENKTGLWLADTLSDWGHISNRKEREREKNEEEEGSRWTHRCEGKTNYAIGLPAFSRTTRRKD